MVEQGVSTDDKVRACEIWLAIAAFYEQDFDLRRQQAESFGVNLLGQDARRRHQIADARVVHRRAREDHERLAATYVAHDDAAARYRALQIASDVLYRV